MSRLYGTLQIAQPRMRRKTDLKPRCIWPKCKEPAKIGSDYCRWHQNKCPDCGAVIHNVSKHCARCAQSHITRKGQTINNNGKNGRARLTPRGEILEMINDYKDAIRKAPSSENASYFKSRIVALTNELRKYD